MASSIPFDTIPLVPDPESLETLNPKTASILPRHLSLTTIPYTDYTSAHHTMMICSCDAVIPTLPTHLAALAEPLPPAYILRDIPKKGLGLVSTRPIACGELLIDERPVCIMPVDITPAMAGDILMGLTIEDREAYLALANCKPEEEGARVLGIFETNSVTVSLVGSEDGEVYGAMLPIISRVNHRSVFSFFFAISHVLIILCIRFHSCGPNTAWRFSLATFSMHLIATRTIAADTELSVTYCQTHLSRNERLKELYAKYRFPCTCPHCVVFVEQSDIARWHLGHQMRKDRMWDDPEDAIHTSKKRLCVIEREGVEGSYAYPDCERIACCYGRLGDGINMGIWGTKAMEVCLNVVDLAGELKKWQGWIADPEQNFPEWRVSVEKEVPVNVRKERVVKVRKVKAAAVSAEGS